MGMTVVVVLLAMIMFVIVIVIVIVIVVGLVRSVNGVAHQVASGKGACCQVKTL